MTGFFGRRVYKKILKKAACCMIKSPKKPGQQMHVREWSNLPPELLSLIAECAGPFELWSFKSVCKAWNSASSTALAQIIETERNQEPWFLLFNDENSECQVLTGSGKKLTTSLPELNGTSCLATYQGWLLLFKQGCGSMFFFNPFSRDMIDLPEFPDSELTDHVAAISCLPTFQDCVLCVISRSNDAELGVKVLYLGEDQAWTETKHSCSRVDIDTIKCAVYHIGKFFFFDHRTDRALTLSIQNRAYNWRTQNITTRRGIVNAPGLFFFGVSELEKSLKNMKKKLGLTDQGVSISTCGTVTLSNGLPKFIFNESMSDHVDESKNRHFKGIWIQPKFNKTADRSQDNEAQN